MVLTIAYRNEELTGYNRRHCEWRPLPGVANPQCPWPTGEVHAADWHASRVMRGVVHSAFGRKRLPAQTVESSDQELVDHPPPRMATLDKVAGLIGNNKSATRMLNRRSD